MGRFDHRQEQPKIRPQIIDHQSSVNQTSGDISTAALHDWKLKETTKFTGKENIEHDACSQHYKNHFYSGISPRSVSCLR
jgi:hypothetical protein